ncbi:acyltransferase family protein [Methylomonas sp. YC3]
MKTDNPIRQRLVDIDRAKGFAIFLVVLGHIVAGKTPLGNEWYDLLKMGIYKFHMPFFMYLSGLVFAYTYPGVSNFDEYIHYIGKRIKKLCIGYIAFGVLIYMGKITMSSIMFVDDAPGGFYIEIFNLMVFPSESAGGSLWFIYVLMEIYIIIPLLMMALKSRLLVVICSAIVHFLPLSHMFLMDRFAEYLVYFSIGIFVIEYYDFYMKLLDRFFVVAIVLFLSSFLSIEYLSASNSKFLIGLLSLLAVHSAMRNGFLSRVALFGQYGKYTYSIYLMNTIAIGLVKGVILFFTPLDGRMFIFMAPILLLAGIYIPIYIKKYIFIRFSYVDRVTT